MIEGRDGEQQAGLERVHPGETCQRVALSLDVADAGRFGVRVIGNLIIVPAKRRDEPELVVGVAIVDERPHSSEPPHAVVQDIRTRSFQPIVASVAVDTGKIGELLGVAAEIHLVVGLVKRAEGREQLALVVPLEAGSRHHVEHAVGAVAVG